MNLSLLTNENLITLNGTLETKEEIIDYLIEKLYQDGKITSKQAFKEAVMYRESLTPTGIDQGLAIPHGKDESVKEASFAVMTLQQPVTSWGSVVPGNKVKYVFLLAEMMQKMSNEDYTKALYASTSAQEFFTAFRSGCQQKCD